MLGQPGCLCMECAVGNVLFAVLSVWRALGLGAAPCVPHTAQLLGGEVVLCLVSACFSLFSGDSDCGSTSPIIL